MVNKTYLKRISIKKSILLQTRPRKVNFKDVPSDSSSTTPKRQPDIEPKPRFYLTHCRILFGCICLIIASYFGYVGYLETRVNTPFDNQKVCKKIITKSLFINFSNFRWL